MQFQHTFYNHVQGVPGYLVVSKLLNGTSTYCSIF